MTVHLDLNPLTLEDIPNPSTPEFQSFLDAYFVLGTKLAGSMDHWLKHSSKVNDSVQIVNLTSASSMKSIRRDLNIKDYWCGRMSRHTPDSVGAMLDRSNSGPIDRARNLVRRLSGAPSIHDTEEEGHASVMKREPRGLYEQFRRGLLEYHSENEREYIEACRETECLEIFEPHVAEVWRLTYVTPPPTSPRTFVVLLLSRELDSREGQRSFMNISIPFAHPKCPEKQGSEKSRVRGRYVSVERVCEDPQSGGVEWRMATCSDAGGNIPRFITNSSLPGSISQDVPAFLKYISGRFAENKRRSHGDIRVEG